jgi:putative membrane-bound dehydrogenase-like protein
MLARSLIATAGLLVGGSISATPTAGADLSPHAINTQQPDDEPTSAADMVRAMTVPAGFRTVLFAAEPDVCQPIAITTDERGRLWVVENYSYPEWRTDGTDRVLIFEDTDGDGRFDTRKVFLEGGRNLTGIEIGRGGVWLSSPPELVFVPDRDRDDRPDGPPEPILDGFNADRVAHNAVNGLRWGPDGWLYGRHGIQAKSRVGRPDAADSDRLTIDCSIWRVHPESRRFEVVARGTTNPWGMDYDDLGEMVFTNNVNGHLWHLIPGAHYERMHGVDPEPHVYEFMSQCADHLHWPGGAWHEAREVEEQLAPAVDELGGGHSHCGGLIYLGDMFPDEWRGKIFICNTHGKRVNVDRLEHGPRGLVGRHEPDFLKAHDTWFRGIELVSGPDGRVWIADWTDKGECHDHDGVHRTSGRIYTVLHGDVPPLPTFDLHGLSDLQLVELQLHRNDWFCRTARRILADRAAAGRDLSAAAAPLRGLAETHADPGRRLRGLWAAHAIGAADPAWLRARLADDHPSVRAWSVRLLADHARADGPAAVLAVAAIVSHAAAEPAGLVRLHLAGSLERLPYGARWAVAESLATRTEDADWQSLALLIWYGLRGPVGQDPARGASLAARTPMPALRRLVARRLAFDADRSSALAEALERLLAQTAADAGRRADVHAGVAAAWQGRTTLSLPAPLLAVVLQDPVLAELGKPRAAAEPAASDAARAAAAAIVRLQTAGPSTPELRRAGITAWRAKLTPEELARADLPAGRLVWEQRCGVCHRLFGEGGNVGPELTGSGRADTDYVILNVMDPSAVVPEAWRLTQVITADGRVLAGALVASDERTLTLRTPAGDVTLDREEIDEVVTRNESVMPEGLWNDLTDEQVRDLVAYLASPRQVPVGPP